MNNTSWKWSLSTHLIAMSLILQISALDVHRVRMGQNTSVKFSQEVNEHSVVEFELFTLSNDHPFYTAGNLYNSVLHPRQRGRFSVEVSQAKGDNINIDIFKANVVINEVQELDEGVYIAAIKETNNRDLGNEVTNHILDSFIKVITPPGKAECSIAPSSHASHLREVHCQANAGSDGSGGLLCYQNSRKVPYLRPTTYSAPHITAVFWMSIKYPITCCSFDNTTQRDPDTCSEFQYSFQGEYSSTSPPASVRVDSDPRLISRTLQPGRTTPKEDTVTKETSAVDEHELSDMHGSQTTTKELETPAGSDASLKLILVVTLVNTSVIVINTIAIMLMLCYRMKMHNRT